MRNIFTSTSNQQVQRNQIAESVACSLLSWAQLSPYVCASDRDAHPHLHTSARDTVLQSNTAVVRNWSLAAALGRVEPGVVLLNHMSVNNRINTNFIRLNQVANTVAVLNQSFVKLNMKIG